MKKLFFLAFVILFAKLCPAQQPSFAINSSEYFEKDGVNVMVFQDFYPEGHQGGVGIIMHGKRLATNGDLRLDETPGGNSPIPGQLERKVDAVGNAVTVRLAYPDPKRNKQGFSPIDYPDLDLKYTVKVRGNGNGVVVSVDLDEPLPPKFTGKVGFMLELFPGWLYGKTWYLDNASGIFPRQPNGPAMKDTKGEVVANMPMAVGKKLSVSPEDKLLHLTIQSTKGDLQLLDGRYVHNNGWFVVRSVIAENSTKNAVEWIITPSVVPGWKSEPVVHVSQVGYRPEQEKVAIIELDKKDTKREVATLVRINPDGEKVPAGSFKGIEWGQFLRYNYVKVDFTSAKQDGMYFIRYGASESQPFRISANVYKRDVWQPTLEYFLPVQMCHMKINEKYRTWHGLCHMDDALMAPVYHNHFDGYLQAGSTYTSFKPGDHVPGINVGGWHDAGDYDLRVESQSGEAYILSMIYEEFGIDYDETYIDQKTRIVEIHQPDGKPDVLQQIEHGILSVLGGYKSLGRLYRGIIESDVRQYVLLGDGSTMTDGLIYDRNLKEGERTASHSAVNDDRWVFTEDNPPRELTVAAHLAASARVLKGFNDELSRECIEAAEAIFAHGYKVEGRVVNAKIHAASELFLSTGKDIYRKYLLDNREAAIKGISNIGWALARAVHKINDPEFTAAIKNASKGLSDEINKQAAETPFGVPYRPRVWGAGWDIQEFGVRQYFLYKAFPDVFSAAPIFNAMNFVLGVHPGENGASFASGIGARSTIIAYGVNRADESYIPGGVASGTSLIRPDFPELLDWPYLWQQTEYVMGGGATNFTFLVLATDHLHEKSH
ncbi:MAG: glycoside hydrolase [Bacteroidales bacterium]|nr:glycoside hydrolase [Bacteroidales bacterium]